MLDVMVAYAKDQLCFDDVFVLLSSAAMVLFLLP